MDFGILRFFCSFWCASINKSVVMKEKWAFLTEPRENICCTGSIVLVCFHFPIPVCFIFGNNCLNVNANLK